MRPGPLHPLFLLQSSRRESDLRSGREEGGNMSCLASLAAGSEGLKAACGLAEAVVAIDGCGIDEAR
ncbi:MAG: putative zinc-binding protein [Synergistales bacterium]|nr:putative zinc-binding protein [Synergistales bacterium]